MDSGWVDGWVDGKWMDGSPENNPSRNPEIRNVALQRLLGPYRSP